jgi:hypothetical protein
MLPYNRFPHCPLLVEDPGCKPGFVVLRHDNVLIYSTEREIIGYEMDSEDADDVLRHKVPIYSSYEIYHLERNVTR